MVVLLTVTGYTFPLRLITLRRFIVCEPADNLAFCVLQLADTVQDCAQFER